MLDPLTSQSETYAIVQRPFKACQKCLWFSQRSEMVNTPEGLTTVCNLEHICRNAVHIAWMSLTEEEQQEMIEKETGEQQDDTY